MLASMSRLIVRLLTPWRLKRERDAKRLAALRQRDGDSCARCRRPMRFDLPSGHEQAVKIEPFGSNDFRLCHPRCNQPGLDLTGEVTERVKRKNEAALFAKPRRKKAA
jgi:hypothetical protein